MESKLPEPEVGNMTAYFDALLAERGPFPPDTQAFFDELRAMTVEVDALCNGIRANVERRRNAIKRKLARLRRARLVCRKPRCRAACPRPLSRQRRR